MVLIDLTPEKLRMLNILLKNKAIFEMCLEDLNIWKGFEKIYPSYVRFPECFDWGYPLCYLKRKKAIKDIEQTIKQVDIAIRGTTGQIKIYPSISSKFLKERKKLLEKHLKRLRKIRDKRYREINKEYAKEGLKE